MWGNETGGKLQFVTSGKGKKRDVSKIKKCGEKITNSKPSCLMIMSCEDIHACNLNNPVPNLQIRKINVHQQ